MILLFFQDQKTALYWAVEKGHVAIGKVLLDYHADTEITNKVQHILHNSYPLRYK